MTKKAEENEVSRRDFIKELGGGAIGAAIISTELLARPVDAAQNGKVDVHRNLKKNELGGRWDAIRGYTEAILKQFSGLGAMQVNWRLNVSGKMDPQPIFIDWFATRKISEGLLGKSGVKIADIGERRLGDWVTSVVYDQGLDQAGTAIVVRDWMNCSLVKEKKVESQLLVQKAGLLYQKFIGILAREPEGKKQRRRVGLLTVSFQTAPSNQQAVDDLMKKLAWADNPKSDFVKYIEGNFVLGGPPA